jgi:hypothetical protein
MNRGMSTRRGLMAVVAFAAVSAPVWLPSYYVQLSTRIGLVFVLLILFLPGGVLGSREQLERLAGRSRFRGPGRGSVTTPEAKPANAVNATGTFRRWKHRE